MLAPQKDVPGDAKTQETVVPAATTSKIHTMDSRRPSDIEEVIKRIKAMATERIRQKSVAIRPSLATITGVAPSSKEDAPKPDSDTEGGTDELAATAGVLHIPLKDTPKEATDLLDGLFSAATKLNLALEPVKNPGTTKADETSTNTKADDLKSLTPFLKLPLKDTKLPETKAAVLKQDEAKPASVFIVPKSKPKVFEPKLPQTGDGFSPQPWVKRRYTISQLLLLGEIMPYIICPRDRFNINSFSYDLVHIPGLGNESTGNHLVDHQILTLNLRTELIAFQYFTTCGYRYLERFKNSDHTLYVKGLWVEVRRSARLRDHGGYRNAYCPKPYDACVKEGLIKENQEAKALDRGYNNNHGNHLYPNNNYRGRGSRGGRGGIGYRGGSSRGNDRGGFVSASTDRPLLEENSMVSLPAPNPSAHPGPIVSNDIALATAKQTGALHELSKSCAEIQFARTEVEGVAAGLGHGAPGKVVELVQQAKEKLAEKKAEITNKWGGIYGYAMQDPNKESVEKPKGLGGASSTQEQQMQYIKYMLQTPLAPVLDTTQAAGSLTPSMELAQSNFDPKYDSDPDPK
ncbi:uncharacterized protein DFL_009788 [Arthrobotrys flagrans]|uniref:Uncharacterized protein n=1 Tax=Arthrobotrys flagrans TaxID=97331 RepID=A0A436ZSW6_ARTFL|nr:hypothetical protein DFL_009788 [Arthrobotrys flagrans]